MSSISEFKSKVATDFARPNLFECTLNFPEVSVANGTALTDLGKFTVKAANLPATQLGTIEVPYRGRVLKIAGDRTFEPWTITVLNDQSFKFRSFFESWSTNIQALQQNFQNANTMAEYQAMAKVRQMDRKGKIIRTYKFEGIWPSNISSIGLDWGTTDTPEEYTVEFQVQYWTYDNDVNTGNAG